MFSYGIFKNFKNTYFEEYLGTTASQRLRKISPLLVLGKALLDGKQHNWVTNAFYWKYEPHEVGFVIFMLFLSSRNKLFRKYPRLQSVS